jgi:hypothetical protein
MVNASAQTFSQTSAQATAQPFEESSTYELATIAM